MERPLKAPNLPANPVRLCVAALREEIANRLKKEGIELIAPLPDDRLPAEERRHADLLFCHGGGGSLFASPSQTPLLPEFNKRGFTPTVTDALDDTYPANVRLNVAVGRDFALGNLGHCDPLLLAALQNGGKTLLTVKQGYAKCSLCFVSDAAFITEDAGIEKALSARGFDVLLISKGDVYLSEKHYGFFGGATGKIAPDKLAVNGSLQTHRDGERIRGFLRRHGVVPLELHGGQIADVGGILPLTEEGA